MHYSKWRRNQVANASRKSEYKIHNAVAQAHRNQLYTTLALPLGLRDILRSPADEADFAKLEEVRLVMIETVQGKESFHIENADMAADIAKAIVNCPRQKFFDEVGPGSALPDGCRVIFEDASSKDDVVAYLEAITDDWILILKYPFGTPREPFVSELYTELADANSADEFASDLGLTAEEILDRMLLATFDSMWLSQSETWTMRQVSNITESEPFELARYFMKGQDRNTQASHPRPNSFGIV